MDLLRSCYSQKIRYIKGDLAQEETTAWYFCAKTAKPFPFNHAFGSPTWDIVHPTPTTIGFNAQASRQYYSGRSLNNSRGDKFAGPAAWFAEGAPAPANLPRALNGTPLECLQNPLGLALSGGSVDVAPSSGTVLLSAGSYVPAVACSECTGPTPSNLSITLSGFTTPAVNATWTFTQDGTFPCQWNAGSGGVTLTLQRSGGFFWNLTILDGTGAALYQGGGVGCLGSFSMAQLVSTIGGNTPLTLLTS